MSSKTTLDVLRFLAVTYEHRWKPDTAQLTAWAVLLEDIPVPVLQRAALQFAQTSEHPPTPAGLRKLAEPDKSISGEEAFDIVRRAARHASPYDQRCCEEAWAALERKDPALAHAARAIGGFRAFWDLTNEEVGVFRAQFRGIWESVKRRSRIETDEGNALAAAGVLGKITMGQGPRKLL